MSVWDRESAFMRWLWRIARVVAFVCMICVAALTAVMTLSTAIYLWRHRWLLATWTAFVTAGLAIITNDMAAAVEKLKERDD